MTTESMESIKAELEKVCGTVNLLDCLSQDAFSQIATVARLTLLAMETPHPPSREQIADVLQLITVKSEDTQNLINVEAERVGCNYRDEAKDRRWDAARAAEQGKVA